MQTDSPLLMNEDCKVFATLDQDELNKIARVVKSAIATETLNGHAKNKGNKMDKLALLKLILDDSGTEVRKPPSSGFSEGLKIVVLQRGWVIVGDLKYHGQEGVLTNASVIRIWGTQKGIGQLALEGKQKETVLDPCGTCRFKVGTEIFILDCEESKWK